MIYAIQVQKLRDNYVGDSIVNACTQKDDAFFQQETVNVKSASPRPVSSMTIGIIVVLTIRSVIEKMSDALSKVCFVRVAEYPVVRLYFRPYFLSLIKPEYFMNLLLKENIHPGNGVGKKLHLKNDGFPGRHSPG